MSFRVQQSVQTTWRMTLVLAGHYVPYHLSFRPGTFVEICLERLVQAHAQDHPHPNNHLNLILLVVCITVPQSLECDTPVYAIWIQILGSTFSFFGRLILNLPLSILLLLELGQLCVIA